MCDIAFIPLLMYTQLQFMRVAPPVMYPSISLIISQYLKTKAHLYNVLILMKYRCTSPLDPHDASKHHFPSLKNNSIS